MKKIASFTIDHIKLQPGIYVSRKDYLGDQVITTFDIRMTSPNEEPVMNTAELHAMEHLAATFLRNHAEFGSKIIYWGPMGCRTGNYLLLAGDYESKDIVPLMQVYILHKILLLQKTLFLSCSHCNLRSDYNNRKTASDPAVTIHFHKILLH